MRSLTTGLLVLFSLSFGPLSPAADFNGDGTGDIAIFRASSGLWAVRGVTRVYFGSTSDDPVPGDYDGNGTDTAAIFRPSSGLWAVRDVTRVYFGSATDEPRPGDYTGDGTYDVGIFRGSSGLWAVRGATRTYFGTSGDVAIAAGKVARPGRLSVTGQFAEYSSGDDGTYQAGAAFNFQTVSIGGDLVTVDHNTGLMWAANGEDKGCNWGNQTDWSAAINWCNNLDFGGYTDWRLPNVRELQSIVDYGAFSPTIDTTNFVNAKSDYYWSSTTFDKVASSAWYVDFSDGDVHYNNKTSNNYVRAVRGGE